MVLGSCEVTILALCRNACKSTVGGFEFTFQRELEADETFVSIPDHVDIFIP